MADLESIYLHPGQHWYWILDCPPGRQPAVSWSSTEPLTGFVCDPDTFGAWRTGRLAGSSVWRRENAQTISENVLVPHPGRWVAVLMNSGRMGASANVRVGVERVRVPPIGLNY